MLLNSTAKFMNLLQAKQWLLFCLPVLKGLKARSDTLDYVDLISISLILHFFSLKSQPCVISLPPSSDKKAQMQKVNGVGLFPHF